MSAGIFPFVGSMPFLGRFMDKNTVLYKNKTAKRKQRYLLLLLAAFSAVSVCVCVASGASNLGINAFFRVLTGTGSESEKLIIMNIRLPRVLSAVAAGTGLSLSGCIMQKVLGNPMASPSTLGVSNGAVFGANAAIILFGAGTVGGAVKAAVTFSNTYIVTMCAFLSAFSGILVILLLSVKKRFSSETVVLCGVAIGSFFSAGTTLLQYFSADTHVSSAVFWSFGDLGRASAKEAAVMLAAAAAVMIFAIIVSRDLDILSSGDETAASLGINTALLRFFSLLSASVVCAICVSFLGIIGFVGLIAPQAARRFLGEEMSVLAPGSAFCGITLLALSDAAARSIIPGVSLPVGAVTSVIGGPVFLYILLRSKKGGLNRAA